jgi:cytochrome P450
VEGKAFAEVDEVLEGQVPGVEDVPKLRYTAMLLAESVRLYPPTWISI